MEEDVSSLLKLFETLVVKLSGEQYPIYKNDITGTR